MACARNCRALFRLAVLNNVERCSIARCLSVNLIPPTPSKVIFRHIRGKIHSNVKREEYFENSDSINNKLEESSIALSDQSSKTLDITEKATPDISLVEEEFESVEGVLIKIKANEDHLNADNSLYYLKKLVYFYRGKKTNLSLEEIQNSNELFLLLKTCQKHLGTIHADNLVHILDNLRKLGIPDKAVIMLQLLRLLKEDFNNLSFQEACNLFSFVKNITKNADAHAIKIALKEALPLKFKENFDRDNKLDVKTALRCLVESPTVLSPCNIEICDAVVHMCELEGDQFSRDVIIGLLIALKSLNKNDPKFKKISLMSFNIVKKVALMDLPFNKVHVVFNHYAYLATGKYVEYDEIVVNNLGKKVVESSVPAFKKLIITDGMNKMGHNQIEVADHFADLVIAEPRLLIDHCCTHEFIKFLYNSNYKNLKKDKWEEKLKPIIKNLPLLKDKSRWNNFIVTDLVIDLIALDIFPDYIFEILSEKYNSGLIVKEDWTKIKVLVAINQAVNLWHPDFGKPVLSKLTIDLIIQHYKERLVAAKPWPSEVKTFLEQATGVKDSVLLYGYSAQGILIQEVMVLDRKNMPMPLTGLQNKGPLQLELLQSRLQNKKLVLLLNCGKKSYSANFRNLFSLASVTVKALEEQGFFVIPILEDEWFELNERERGLYLWKCIQEKIPASWNTQPTTINKITEVSEKIKDTILSSAQKVRFSNFFNR